MPNEFSSDDSACASNENHSPNYFHDVYRRRTVLAVKFRETETKVFLNNKTVPISVDCFGELFNNPNGKTKNYDGSAAFFQDPFFACH